MDYRALAAHIIGMAQPVADKMNPLKEGISNPAFGTEGARPYAGGAGVTSMGDASVGGGLRPGGAVLERWGKRYHVNPFTGPGDKEHYEVYVEVGKPGGGTTWRTLNGMNKANRNQEMNRIIAEYLKERGD